MCYALLHVSAFCPTAFVRCELHIAVSQLVLFLLCRAASKATTCFTFRVILSVPCDTEHLRGQVAAVQAELAVTVKGAQHLQTGLHGQSRDGQHPYQCAHGACLTRCL